MRPSLNVILSMNLLTAYFTANNTLKHPSLRTLMELCNILQEIS